MVIAAPSTRKDLIAKVLQDPTVDSCLLAGGKNEWDAKADIILKIAIEVLEHPSYQGYCTLASHWAWHGVIHLNIRNRPDQNISAQRLTRTECCKRALALLSPTDSLPYSVIFPLLIGYVTDKTGIVFQGKEWTLSQCIEALIKWEPPEEDRKHYADSWGTLGIALQRENKVLETSKGKWGPKDCFQRCVAIDPKNGESWNFLGYSASLEKLNTDPESAIDPLECFCKAVETCPEKLEFWGNLARTLHSEQKVKVNGKEMDRIDCVRQILARDSDCTATWIMLADFLFVQGKEFDATGIRGCAGKMTPSDIGLKILHISEYKGLNFQKAAAWRVLGQAMPYGGGVQYKKKVYGKLECFVSSLSYWPESVQAWVSMGRLLRKFPSHSPKIGTDVHTARSCFIQAAERAPQEILGWYDLVDTLKPGEKVVISQKEMTKLDCCRKLLALDPKCAEHWVKFGEALLQGEFAEFGDQRYDRKGCLLHALQIESRNADYWRYLGHILQEDKSGANIEGTEWGPIACFVRALEINADYGERWSSLGVALYAAQETVTVLGTCVGAGQCFVKALTLNEKDGRTWCFLAQYLAEGKSLQGESEKWLCLTPLDCYVHAMECAQDAYRPEIWFNIGCWLTGGKTAFIEEKSWDEKACYVQSLERGNRKANPWICLGKLLKENESVTVGKEKYTLRKCFLKALEIDPQRIDAWKFLIAQMNPKARIEFHGRKMSCVDCAMEIVKVNPQDEEGWCALAAYMEEIPVVELEGKKYTRSECVLQALRIRPKFAKAWHLLGVILGGQQTVECEGKRWDSISCYVQAVNLNPKDWEVWKDLGKLLTDEQKVPNGNGGEISKEVCSTFVVLNRPQDVESWVVLGDCCAQRGISESSGTCVEVHVGTESFPETFSLKTCYLKALTLGWKQNPERLWCAIAEAMEEKETVPFCGKDLHQVDCYLKALEANENQPLIWRKVGLFLASHPALKKKHSWQECLAKSLSHDATDVVVWEVLVGQMKVSDKIMLSKKSLTWMGCAQRLLEIHPLSKVGWRTLATQMKPEQSLKVGEGTYNADACHHKYIQCFQARDWIEIGETLGVGEEFRLGDRGFSRTDCFAQMLTCTPAAEDWVALGKALGSSTFSPRRGETIRAYDCALYALEKDLECAAAWELFKSLVGALPSPQSVHSYACHPQRFQAKDWIERGKRLGEGEKVQVGDKSFSRTDCFAQMLTCTPAAEDWVALGKALGSSTFSPRRGETIRAYDCALYALEKDLECAAAWELFKSLVGALPSPQSVSKAD